MHVPVDIERVFAFFKRPENLETITPSTLDFEILTELPVPMHEGAIIDYRLKVHGIPLRWRTKITDWSPPMRFRDSQVKGPYLLWDHEHEFRESGGGTLVIDRVHYRAPLGFILHPLIIDPDVRKIFQYRQTVIRRVFRDRIGRLARSFHAAAFTQVVERTGAAAGVDGPADGLAQRNKVPVPGFPIALRKNLPQGHFGRMRGIRRDKAEPVGYAVNMRIHAHAVLVKSRNHDEVSRFATHPGQGTQVVDVLRNAALESVP